MDLASLAARAHVPRESVERFERGEGGLGLAALNRLARALGVDSAEFAHTSIQEGSALIAPEVLLKQRGSADLEQADLDVIADGLKRARAFVELGTLMGVEQLADAFQPSPAPQEGAHKDGYRWALEVRGMLPERTGPIYRLCRLIENRFNILVRFHAFRNKDVLGASCRIGTARLIVVSAHLESEAQRRFVLAHELAHHLLDLGGESVQTDTGTFEQRRFWLENTPIEKRANAFAAMLLAPAPAMQEVFGPPASYGNGLIEARDLVGRARHRFGLSFSAMTWHLKNLKYIKDESTVDALLMTADSADISDFELDTRFDGLERRVLEAFQKEMISSGRARELLGLPIEELAGACRE